MIAAQNMVCPPPTRASLRRVDLFADGAAVFGLDFLLPETSA